MDNAKTLKVFKTSREWRTQLSELSYRVTREAATERPYMDHDFPKMPGKFCCICCELPLFNSDTKYDSGSGWPSFYDIIEPAGIEQKSDKSHNMERIEVTCSRCDAHLGHVFPDGPEPTGLRYCINGSALKFKAG